MDKIPYPKAALQRLGISINDAHGNMKSVASSKSSVTFRQFLKHPIIITRGLVLAHRLKCQFNGTWKCGAIEFHDHITGGGFTLMPGAQTIWHARGKLLELRKRFERPIPRLDEILDGRN